MACDQVSDKTLLNVTAGADKKEFDPGCYDWGF